ncbi:MAG: hypothetical protein ACFFD5_14975 [Candidatus Thorarchaeota archaeon]
MTSLKKLTVSQLESLAKECGIELKKSDKKTEKINKILNENLEESRLNYLIKKYINQKKQTGESFQALVSELKGRIRLLEEQVKFLMSKISVSEITIGTEANRDVITVISDLADVKKFIRALISPGEAITIDELIEIKEIQKIPLVALKHAIYDLIEEDIFDAREGNSRQKIGGKIGILVRKQTSNTNV